MTPKEFFDEEIQPELDRLSELLECHDRCLTAHSIRLQDLEMAMTLNASIDNVNEELQATTEEYIPEELIPDDEGFCDNNPLGGSAEAHDIEAEKE